MSSLLKNGDILTNVLLVFYVAIMRPDVSRWSSLAGSGS